MPASAPSNVGRSLLLIGRLALGAVFLYAAYAKLRQSPLLFALQVDSYQLLPSWAVLLVARTLPWVELAVGVLLVIGYRLRYAAAAASALLLAFFGVMLRTYARGMEINCGCFGPNETLGVKTLLRDGGLLAVSLAVTVGAFWHARTKPAVLAGTPGMERAE